MIYQHKFNENIICEKISATSRGWKVLQTEARGKRKAKVTTQFYNSIDFSEDKGYWIQAHPKKQPQTIQEISQKHALNISSPFDIQNSAMMFEIAIKANHLTLDRSADNYVGYYMYMGATINVETNKQLLLFKHINTRSYNNYQVA